MRDDILMCLPILCLAFFDFSPSITNGNVLAGGNMLHSVLINALTAFRTASLGSPTCDEYRPVRHMIAT